jgi:hypothetical protein
MRHHTSVRALVLGGLLLILAGGWALAETLYRIPVEHNHRVGECQGNLIVRDDKVIFESRTVVGDSRVWEYPDIERIEIKNGYELHITFTDQEHGKGQKYVLKFKNDSPDNQAALDYILRRMRGGPELMGGGPTGENLELPYRMDVELDLNGNNCMGTLWLRADKIVFETGSAKCADRAFVKEWEALKSYRRLSETEFLLVFYKYGSSAPTKITELRFWAKHGGVPPEVDRFLAGRARQ